MILRRYIAANVARPFLTALAFLLMLYLAWTASSLVGEGGASTMTPLEFFSVVGLRAQIALEMLVPMALFLAAIGALGRMSAGQEIVALRACGSGDRVVTQGVLRVALVAAVLVAAQSLWFRPMAYGEIYSIDAAIAQDTDFRRIEGREFYTSDNQERMVFADRREGDTLYQVLLTRTREQRNQVIFAARATQEIGPGGARVLHLRDGHLYEVGRSVAAADDWQMDFNRMRVDLGPPRAVTPDRRRKSTPTRQLARSMVPAEIAEYQGRFSAPLGVLLLAWLAVPLSRYAPRRARYLRILFAALLMIVYYNLHVLARTWMELGAVPKVPGAFWPQLLLMVVLIGLLVIRRRQPRGARGRR